MQCPSCQFENMPGVTACGRCGSSLRLATLTIDVHPPRARAWRKRLRRLTPAPRIAASARDMIEPGWTIMHGAVRIIIPPWPALWRLVVPGWAQLHLGQKQAGRIFLGLYAGLMVLSILTLGTLWTGLALGAAISVHISAVLNLIVQTPGGLSSRLISAALASAVIALIVYVPAGLVLDRIASLQTVTSDVAPFKRGDVVAVNRLAYWRSPPACGDVVFYRLHLQSIRGLPAGINIANGTGVDRVLAGPRAKIQWDGRVLHVDGEQSTWQPLNTERMPGQLAAEVPDGYYLILPSTVSYSGHNVPANVWQALCLVPEANIEGAVYMRVGPVYRLWFIH